MTNPELIGASPRVHARVTGLVGLLVLVSGSIAGLVAHLSELALLLWLLIRGVDADRWQRRILESTTQ